MRTVILLASLLAVAPALAADEVSKILDCMHANVPDTIRVQDISLTTISRDGASTTLRGKIYATREKEGDQALVRAMFRVEEPPSLAGAAYLVRQSDDYLRDGMYVYLPSVRRVRRVSGTFADGSLFGTNFSYQDFKNFANTFGGASATLDGSSTLGNRAVHVLSFRPLASEPSVYTRVVTMVDQKSCLPLQAEFYSGDRLRRKLTVPADAIKQAGKHWYASEVNVKDFVDGGSSVLKVAKVATDTKLGGRYFNPTVFYLNH